MREKNAEGRYFTENIDDLEFSKLKFELIEDEIDIDNIEELKVIDFIKTPGEELSKEENIKRNNQILVDYFYVINDIIKNQNQIVQKLKQLNKEIKSIKEKQ